MKRIVFFIILTSLTVFSFAQETKEENKTSDESFLKIDYLIKDGLKKNFLQIQQESRNITQAQRITLYGLHENKFGAPLALNILLGFGSGSFLQGDTIGGIVGMGGDLAGYAFLITYFLQIINADDWLSSRIRELNSQVMADPVRAGKLKEAQEEYNKKVDDAFKFVYVSVGVLAVVRVVQIVLPITYSSSYNNKLKDALNPSSNLSFYLTPSFDINGNTALTLAVSYRY